MARINHNIPALVSQQSLSVSDRSLRNAMTQLSTGLRINRAADDPTNLSVSEQLRQVIRGSAVVTRNAHDATSLLQIAEGALDEVTNILQRMRELAVQSANGVWTSNDRNYMDVEYQSLKEELDRIAYQTQYNSMQILNDETTSFGSLGGPSVIHIGVNNSIGVDTINVSIQSVTLDALGLETSGIADLNSVYLAVDELDDALFSVSSNRATLGALMNRLEVVVNNLMVQESNTQAAESTIRDTDFARMTTEMVRYQILNEASTAMLAQANSLPKSILGLFDQ